MKKITFLLLFFVTVSTVNAQLYEKRFHRDQTVYPAYSSACATRSNGNNLISINADYTQGSGALAEIDQKGDTIWMKEYKRLGTSYGNLLINFIKELGDKRIFLAGGIHASSGTYSSFFAITDSLGNIQRFKRHNGQSSLNLTLTDVIVDTDTSIYFTGSYYDIYSGGVTFYSWTVPMIGKLKPDLTKSWVYTVGSTNHANNDKNAGIAAGIRFSHDGNLIIYGHAEQDNTLTSGYTFLTKFSKTGSMLWSKKQTRNNDYPIGVEVLPNGDIFTFKRISSTVTVFGNNDLVVEKLNSSGTSVWAKVLGTSKSESFNKVFFDGGTNSFLLAGTQTNTNPDAYFLKIDTSASIMESRLWGKSSGINEQFYDVIRTNANKYLLVGKDNNGSFVVQTDLTGNTTCTMDTSMVQVNSYTSALVNGPSRATENVTPYTYTTEKLSYALTVDTICFYYCPPTTSTINATACGSYTAPDMTVYTTSGTKTAIIQNTSGCDSIITINLTINNVPSQPGVISGTLTLCEGDTATYNVANDPNATGYTWTLPSGWSGSGTSNSIFATSGNNSGTITVTANNSCGSSTPQTVNVTVNPLPNVTYIQSPNIVCSGSPSITLSAGSPSGGTYSGNGVTGNSFNPTTAGVGTHTIIYSYTDVNSCSDTAIQQIQVNICTSINENSINDIKIYPNPFDDVINILLKDNNQSLEIFNVLGEKVITLEMKQTKTQIDMSSFSSGVYYIRLSGNNKVVKVVKK